MKRRTVIYILFVWVFGLWSVCGYAEEFDWPRWRGPNGDGISQETDWDPHALAGSPKILWNVNIGIGHSNVAIKDNRLYTMGIAEREGVVYCLDAETGEEIWGYPYGVAPEPQSTPTIDGKYVYALSKEGILVCLKAKSGKPRWKKDLVSEYDVREPFYGFAGSPVIEGDLVVLTANTSGFAFEKKTGEKVWGSEKPPKERYCSDSNGVEYATPVVYDHGGKRYALVFSYKGLHSVEAETGKIFWLYDLEEIYINFSGHFADPIICNNTIFILGCSITSYGGILLDMGTKEPQVLWKNKDMYSQISTPIQIEGYIYMYQGGVEEGGSLRCLDVRKGEVMWEEKLGNKSIALMAADGKLIILEADGILHIAEANPSSYKEISRCTLPGAKPGKEGFKKYWTPPVLCGGRIYCRNSYGNLVCIDVRK